MKKIILSALTVGVLFVSTSVFAQITVGPKIGYNLSSIKEKVISAGTGLSDGDIKNNSGFNVGVMMNAQIGKYFSIRPELLYNQAGFKYKNSGSFIGTIITDESTINYSYLSIPVNFVGHIPLNDNFKLQGIFGVTTSFGLSGKAESTTTYSNGKPTETSTSTIKMKKDPNATNDNNVYFNALDMGLNFGIGCQYKALVFSAVYNMGLSNIDAHNANQTYEEQRGKDYKLYNKSMSFSVAYLFGGK